MLHIVLTFRMNRNLGCSCLPLSPECCLGQIAAPSRQSRCLFGFNVIKPFFPAFHSVRKAFLPVGWRQLQHISVQDCARALFSEIPIMGQVSARALYAPCHVTCNIFCRLIRHYLDSGTGVIAVNYFQMVKRHVSDS